MGDTKIVYDEAFWKTCWCGFNKNNLIQSKAWIASFTIRIGAQGVFRCRKLRCVSSENSWKREETFCWIEVNNMLEILAAKFPNGNLTLICNFYSIGLFCRIRGAGKGVCWNSCKDKTGAGYFWWWILSLWYALNSRTWNGDIEKGRLSKY